MSKVPVFHGRVTEAGVLELREEERQLRKLHLFHLRGRNVDVIVRKERVQRSLDQNAYLHAVPFTLLAEAIGDSIEGVKFDVLGECFGWTYTKAGHHIPVKSHSSDLTVEEASTLIEWLPSWAMRVHGVSVPLPNEVDY